MARPAYRLLAHSQWDLVPIALGLAHFAFVIWLVMAFHSLARWAIVPLALVYVVSLSWSIGFSQTLYRDIHNRHHRGKDGQPENPLAYTFLCFSATIPSCSGTWANAYRPSTATTHREFAQQQEAGVIDIPVSHGLGFLVVHRKP